MNDTLVIILVLFIGAAIFTDFYGLGILWTNRGTWYTVSFEQLDTVMKNLVQLGAFQDSDSMPNNFIKVKAYRSDQFSTVHYQVKVPNWVFKYHEIKMSKDEKIRLLGIER